MRLTDAELAESRQLFRERVRSTPPIPRPRPRSRRPTLALRVEAAESDGNAMLRPGELAALLSVSPSTIGRWASIGYVPCLRTLGGRRRFRWADVRAGIASRKDAPPRVKNPGLMDVEARATTAGYRLAQRRLNGQLVWWWQPVDDPHDTRQPCWLERRQAISYMQGVLGRLTVPG